MHSPVLICVILKIIFCTKTDHAQSESLIMKEESRYINLSKLPESAPTNLTESNFTKNDCLTESNFTQNDCNPTSRVQRLHIGHIYVDDLLVKLKNFSKNAQSYYSGCTKDAMSDTQRSVKYSIKKKKYLFNKNRSTS